MRKMITLSLLSLGLIIGIFGFQHVTSANNSSFFFNFTNGTANTSAQAKQTTSSVYIRSDNMVGGNGFEARTALANGNSVGQAKTVVLNQDTYLTNYAVENYGSGIRVHINASAPPSGPQSASGYWRPDL